MCVKGFCSGYERNRKGGKVSSSAFSCVASGCVYCFSCLPGELELPELLRSKQAPSDGSARRSPTCFVLAETVQGVSWQMGGRGDDGLLRATVSGWKGKMSSESNPDTPHWLTKRVKHLCQKLVMSLSSYSDRMKVEMGK